MMQSSNLVNYPGLAGPSFVGLSHVLINYEVGLSSKRTWFSIVGDGDTLIDCCHIRPHPIWYPRKTVVFLPHMGSKNIVVSPLTRLGFVYLCYFVLQTMVCMYIYACLTDILTSYIYTYYIHILTYCIQKHIYICWYPMTCCYAMTCWYMLCIVFIIPASHIHFCIYIYIYLYIHTDRQIDR